MADEYGCGERRSKKKDKKKHRKMFPYRKGGRFRTVDIKKTKGTAP